MSGLFLSKSIHKIDKKGRVSVPAGFRNALEAETYRGVALTPPIDDTPCIEGGGMFRIERIAEKITTMNPFSTEHDALATHVLANIHQASFDGEGRIVLPEELMSHAGLTDRALFAGLGSKFQIWRPEAFEDHQRSMKTLARSSAENLPWDGPSAHSSDPE